MAKHNIVVVGGGFAGVKTALKLVEDKRFNVTLISRRDDFQVYGTLYRVSTGGSKQLASIPLTEVFAGKKINIVIGTASSIDRQARTVTTDDKQVFGYEAVVLGLGVTTNFFGIEGLEKYSYGIKSPADAEELKRHLHTQIEKTKQLDLNYVVVGGGPTGVELAGALPAYLSKIAQQHGLPKRKIHVDLIEAGPRLIPRMPKDISRRIARHLRREGVKIYLKTIVQGQTADNLIINNKPLRSHTVIWTAGVTNHPFFQTNGFQLTRGGKVRVDQFLQAEPGIYVIGDNADTAYSGMAQTAINDALYVSKTLKRIADGKDPNPYHAKKPIYVFPAGPDWAATLWGPLRIYGRPAWGLRRLADLIAYTDYQPLQLATKRWLADSIEEEFCSHCSSHSLPHPK